MKEQTQVALVLLRSQEEECIYTVQKMEWIIVFVFNFDLRFLVYLTSIPPDDQEGLQQRRPTAELI